MAFIPDRTSIFKRSGVGLMMASLCKANTARPCKGPDGHGHLVLQRWIKALGVDIALDGPCVHQESSTACGCGVLIDFRRPSEIPHDVVQTLTTHQKIHLGFT